MPISTARTRPSFPRSALRCPRLAVALFRVPGEIDRRGTLSHLYGVHLGSTSVAADGSGAQTAQQTYYAYGTVRTTSGSLATDFTFTGQRLDASDTLMYYGARYYDTAIGRFIQPDSLVPNPYNPQSLNRYSYTLNNPVKYTDPTGHSACVDEDCDVTVDPNGNFQAPNGIDAAANSILEELGGTDDLEALALMADVLASVYDGWDQILPEMSRVFNGSRGYGPTALIAGLSAGGCGGMGKETHDCPGNAGRPQFSDTGFHPDFRDLHDQPYHAWSYVAQTAVPDNGFLAFLGFEIGLVGNDVHEVWQSNISNALNATGIHLERDPGWGTSWQDYTLSLAAMAVGGGITTGSISPSQLGDAMRQTFGPQGPGSYGVFGLQTATYGPLARERIR